ncbi:MAG: PIN domain-containing protein [Bacteroidia bacterium]|nr:PIN domain-containing protein [Bacteroidia bacterium]
MKINKKTYILDTTVLMDNAEIIESLKGSRIVIPLTVIKQLDGLKKSEDKDKAEKSRKASRIILEAQRENKVEVANNFKNIDALSSEADNKIIGTCLMLKEKEKESNVNLLTTDVNMKIAAQSVGIGVEEPETANWIGAIFAASMVGLVISSLFWGIMGDKLGLSNKLLGLPPVLVIMITALVLTFVFTPLLGKNKDKIAINETDDSFLDEPSFGSEPNKDGIDICYTGTTTRNSFEARFWRPGDYD